MRKALEKIALVGTLALAGCVPQGTGTIHSYADLNGDGYMM